MEFFGVDKRIIFFAFTNAVFSPPPQRYCRNEMIFVCWPTIFFGRLSTLDI